MKLVLREDAKVRRMGEVKRPVRMTYRYTTLIPKRNGEVRFVVFAVRLSKDYRQMIQPICTMDTDRDSVALRNVGFHGLAGWIVYWNEEDCEWGSMSSWYGVVRFGEWTDSFTWKMGVGFVFPYAPVLNIEALEGTRYRYHGWQSGCRVGLYDYLRLYRRWPKVELLAKAGLWSIVNTSTMRRLGKNKTLMAFVRAHLAEIAEDGYGITEIDIAMRRGCTLKKSRLRRQTALYMRQYGIRHPMGVDRAVDWLLRAARARNRKSPFVLGVVQEYARYLSYSEEAGYDLTSRHVLFPAVKGFPERLERVEREAAKEALRKKRRESYAARKRRERAKETMKAIVEKFSGATVRGFVVAVPVTQKSLKALGDVMSNCVGDGRYAIRIKDGQSVIIALAAKGKSVACIELDMVRGVVAQCYGPRNTVPPEKAKIAAEDLLKGIKETIKWRKAA